MVDVTELSWSEDALCMVEFVEHHPEDPELGCWQINVYDRETQWTNATVFIGLDLAIRSCVELGFDHVGICAHGFQVEEKH